METASSRDLHVRSTDRIEDERYGVRAGACGGVCRGGIGDAATAAGAPCRKLAHRPFVAAAIKGVDPPWRVRPGAGTNGTADRRAATTAHRAPPDRRRRTLRSLVAVAQRRAGTPRSARGRTRGL